MRKIILSVFLLCLFLTVCAQVFPALPAEADNGIPVLSVTIDPDELQKGARKPGPQLPRAGVFGARR